MRVSPSLSSDGQSLSRSSSRASASSISDGTPRDRYRDEYRGEYRGEYRHRHNKVASRTPELQISPREASACPPLPTKVPTKRLRRALHEELEGQGDEEDEEDDMTPEEILRQDRRDILRPVLEFFDPCLVKRRSALFDFEKKKHPTKMARSRYGKMKRSMSKCGPE